MRSIIVVGGGFAGLASALGAARKLDGLGVSSNEVSITLINSDTWHRIRVRNYEPDITNARVYLSEILSPVGIKLTVGMVREINVKSHTVTIQTETETKKLSYDRLILALGSVLNRPQIPGLMENTFSIDTWDEAATFSKHLCGLKNISKTTGNSTVLIVGAGLTGIELACEMPERLKALGIENSRVILTDRNAHVGSVMGKEAQSVILEALTFLGIERLNNIIISSVDAKGIVLSNGTRIDAKTVVCATSIHANPLVLSLPVAHDNLGRVFVNEKMEVYGCEDVFAAGDIAAAPLGDGHYTVMSCQHARPMGRFAGHNAVSNLLGHEMLTMKIENYVTCLDLGPWGALRTKGWDRQVTASGPDVKAIKRDINCNRIYPPQTGNRHEILEFGSPVIQPPPR